MKIEVWREPEPKKDELTRVRLIDCGLGNTDLCVVGDNGCLLDGGVIGSLSGQGFHRCYSLDPKHGFPLDKEGRIADC